MSERDEAAIVRTLNLYALAMDTQRWDLFDRIFTPDVDADYADPAHWRDLESFKRDFAAYHTPFDSTQHVMMNHLVEVKGDLANSFVYSTWLLIKQGTEGGDHWQGTGWYDDLLVRTADGWRIKKRTCRVLWWEAIRGSTSPTAPTSASTPARRCCARKPPRGGWTS